MLVKNRVAVVTGGSRGIGEAIVKLLLNEGAIVIVGDLSVDKSKELKKKDTKTGELYEANLNIAEKDSVEEFFHKITTKFGRVDILVNNAGVCKDITDFEKMESSEWEQMMNINLMGTVNCTTSVIPLMKEQNSGSIVNMASIAGEIGGTASSIGYSASKAAIICITKVLAKNLGPEGITVNAIAPGYIITEMTKTHVHDLSNVPLRRRGDPIDVANAVLFLASDMGKYITGTTLDVNGGVYMK